MSFSYLVLAGAALLALYTFVGYPLLLRALAALRPKRGPASPHVATPGDPPTVTVTVPVHNEEAQVAGALDALLELDYPRALLRILIVSDGSTDATDAIVASYRDRGVELLSLPRRVGKTAAEEAAIREIRSDLVLNTDASIRLRPDALKELVRAFEDPTVGVASGRDVSVGTDAGDSNDAEGGYVGYEMRVRGLETRVAGIVGASGSCYAVRSSLHRLALPPGLSRDFAAALRAREHGYRAVSVDGAVCAVPRAESLRREYRRKVRTMVRGMRTLAYRSGLLNPFRHGLFAWMLWSHKVARWALPWAGIAALAALAALAPAHPWALAVLALAFLLALATAAAWALDGRVPRAIALPAWVVLGNVAAAHAAVKALGGEQSAIWEPTRRDPAATAGAA